MRSRLKKWFIRSLIATALLFLIVSAAIYVWLVYWVDIFNLPNFTSLENYRPYQTAYFYDRNKEILGCFAHQWRDVIKLEDPSSLLVARVILGVEDRRFYGRNLWIDAWAIGRAAATNVKELRIAEGGSTIPQQLVKRLLPPEEQAARSFERKAKEIFLVPGLLRKFSKNQILTIYLNEIYLDDQRYGIEAAARYNFDKSAENLSLAEAAMIAGMIKSPAPFSPRTHPERAKARRDEILTKFLRDPILKQELLPDISDEAIRATMAEPLTISDGFRKKCSRAPHAVDESREDTKKRLKLFFDEGKRNDAWFGLSIETTIDVELNDYAKDGIRHALSLYKERQKENAIDADGAFYIVNNSTGGIIAMAGSSDYSKIQRNNATNGNRQPGSAFKPIVYEALFEEELLQGEAPEQILKKPVSNLPIRCRKVANPKGPEDYWVPENFDEKKYSAGSYTRRFAIAKSINRPAVHSARDEGCHLHPRVIAMARRLGITSALDPYLPLALGASGISLQELVGAYSVIPNLGFKRDSFIVQEVRNSKGDILYQRANYPARLVFKADIANSLSMIMTDALREAVKSGTAYSLNKLLQPVACKTGTTNDYADASLICFSPELTMGAWIGDPKKRTSLGDREFGATTAGPAVKYVLERWYRDREPVPFPWDIERWNEILKDPNVFEKELKEVPEEEITGDMTKEPE